jgi:nitroreductase
LKAISILEINNLVTNDYSYQILLWILNPLVLQKNKMDMIKQSEFDTAQIGNLIQSRRSVFPDQFVKGKKIPDEIVMEMLENANWAPSHKQTEPWRFSVFSGEGLKKIASFQAEVYKKTSGDKFSQPRYEKLLSTPLLCSYIIAVCMKRSGLVPEIEEIEAVSCALQNLYLSTTAYGLGGYFSTGGVTYKEEAKPFFGLGEQDKLLGFFYLGYVEIPSPAGTRMPVREKIIWIKE